MIKDLGSFTGIRIGVSTVMAFRDSLNIPCIGISSLESLAFNVKEDGFIASILDARNDNCYFALYKKENDKYIQIIEPSTDTICNALELIHTNIKDNSITTFVGDGAEVYIEQIVDKFTNPIFASNDKNTISSYSLGLAGFCKYTENMNNDISDNDILPLYLKKPQAQIQLEKKESNLL